MTQRLAAVFSAGRNLPRTVVYTVVTGHYDLPPPAARVPHGWGRVLLADNAGGGRTLSKAWWAEYERAKDREVLPPRRPIRP